MRQTYSVLVVFLQLLLVTRPDVALAQDPNAQSRLQQMMPSPSVQTPDFNAGRSNQPSRAHAQHRVHRQKKKQQAPAGK
jgi:hypothetical protein